MEDNYLDDFGLSDDFYDDIELIFNVVYVKFSKYSKLYAYLIEESAEVGQKVWVKDKNEPLEIIKIAELKESELPVPFEKMKYATLNRPFENCLLEVLNNNKVLRRVEKKTDLIGREDILVDLMVSINKKRMRNSILIGDAGCGKTTIVESFSDLIKSNYIVLAFNVGELISGTIYRGQLEEKLTKIFNDILDFNLKNQMKIILFIDEFHMIISNAGCDSGVSLHDILKPYLTNNNLIVIGATTINEYNKYVKKDVALMRRITPIFVNKLSDMAILDILDNFSNHEVKRELLKNILNETKNIPNTTNPDISLEVLDRVLAKHEILGCDINMEIINKEIFKLKECYECL